MALYQIVAEWTTYLTFYLLCAVFIAFVGYCLYVWHIHQKYDHIPGPPRDNFLLGHIPTFRREMNSDRVIHDRFLEWTEKYGPVYRINTFHTVSLVVSCPEATKEILMSPKYSKDPLAYKRIFHLFGLRFLGNGLVTAVDHDTWYKQRRIMDPAFSSSYLRGLMDTFNERAECLMQHLEVIAEERTIANMHRMVNCVTLDVICKVAFGVDLDLLKHPDSPFPNAIDLCLQGMIQDIRDPFFRHSPWNRKKVREIQEAVKLLRTTGAKWINQRRKAVENAEDVPKDILTKILKTAEELKADGEENHEVMLDNFVTFFIAGQETTASQLSFAIMELGRHPEILKRTKEEVDEVLGTRRDVLYEDLGKLTYLTQVLKETLRLYPPAVGTSRWIHEDTVISGFKIPAGCSILFSSYITSRMEKFFKDPLKFDPERFHPDASKPYFSYYPFSLGPRSCLGQTFSQMEAKVVLTKFLQRFDFSLVPGQSFDIKDTGSLRPRSGVLCTIKHCAKSTF
ncbi:cholesterol 24-hydroxylase-like isoform X1 [Electrophorus electricus]|uniref:Cholesterol 24-hydroxylase n=1 Tax=Electrophorus electricus TaxID=8005 RepID=A0A4W4EVD1_ELEEL|nr:cholesterol 24-hydroxylase-like isoform X1 [Electrophorus electricus]